VDGLLRQLAQWQIVLMGAATADQVRALQRGALVAAAVAAAQHTYAAKEQAVIGAAAEHHATAPGAYFMRAFERMVMLQVIDVLWADHIAHLDLLRSGAGLRRLAGRDPLAEYRRDAFRAFERQKGEVRSRVVDALFRAGVPIQVAEAPRSRGADA
jgi:preprotein translocase subunit SecA